MPLSDDPAKRQRQLANLRPAPPAPKGNQRALTTGRTTKTPPGIDALRVEITASVPVRGPDGELSDADRLIVELLAREFARYRFMDDWAVTHGVIARGGKLRTIVQALDRSARTISELSDKLGLNAQSRMRLGVSMMRGFDLASQFAELDDE